MYGKNNEGIIDNRSKNESNISIFFLNINLKLKVNIKDTIINRSPKSRRFDQPPVSIMIKKSEIVEKYLFIGNDKT